MLFTLFKEGKKWKAYICRLFFFVRHGETDWNRECRIMGCTDIPLNEMGRKQALALQDQIKDLDIKTICTSPLKRALQTAEILNEVLAVPIIKLPDLKEVGWGVQEGQVKGSPASGERMLENYKQGIHPARAEAYELFEKRVVKGINEAFTFPDPVLVVSHGGVFWSLATCFKWQTNKLLTNCQLL